MTLFDKEHPFCRCKSFTGYAVEIHTPGKTAAVENSLVFTGSHESVDKVCNFLPGNVINGEPDSSGRGYAELNRGRWIERIRAVLTECKCMRIGSVDPGWFFSFKQAECAETAGICLNTVVVKVYTAFEYFPVPV